MIHVNRNYRLSLMLGTASMQEAIIISWAIRGFLIASGFLASCLVARDAPQFGIMQMAVMLILIVFIVAVVAFWSAHWSHLNRLRK